MSASLEALTTIVDAMPGEIAIARVAIHNSANTDADFAIRVVGLDDGDTTGDAANLDDAAFTASVPANTLVECAVPIRIPGEIATGQHAAAFQATSNRPSDRPLLAPFTVSVESVERLSLVVEPSTIRGRRRGKFLLGVGNGEETPVAFTLDAEATDVRVRFATRAFKLLPGERSSTRAKVRGPRHLVGEPIQHNLVIAARGKASATTITAPFVQRPFFAHKLRAVVAALAVIALWLGAIGGVALWISNRNDEANADLAAAGQDAALVRLVDANGDVLDGGPYTVTADGSIVDADGAIVDGFSVDPNGNVVDGDGNPVNGVNVSPDGTLVDDVGTPIGLPPPDDAAAGGPGSGADGGGGAGTSADDADDPPDPGVGAPTSTDLRGTVSAENVDDLSDVAVTLVPIDLGTTPPPGSTVIDPPGRNSGDGGPPPQTSAGKIWSARQAPIASTAAAAVRQTESVAPLVASPEVDGLWMIPDVPLRRTYELSFAKEGFDTQSFVISPPDDGTPVELDVTLLPAGGTISGRVIAGGSPLGGVEIAISDGTLVFTTTSQTDGDVGAFSFDAVSTPGVYTLTATRSGFGTEVLQLPMDAGEQLTEITVQMSAGVATVSGTIVDERGAPVPGAVVTAANGEITRTTTSLTEGRTGFYSIPQLDVPATYIITVEAPGFLPQTRRVPMSGSISGVGFALIETTSRLTGVVTSSGGGGIAAAGVTLSNADLQFEVSTAESPTRGAYAIDDLPPGNYTVTFDHFRHTSVTEFLTITEGVDPPPLDVTLATRPLVVDAGTGSLVVEVIDPNAEEAEDREIEGATIRLIETRTGEERYRIDDAPSFTTEFNDIVVGTYTILVSAPSFNDAAPRQVSIGQSQERRTIEMLAFGAASGSMIDSITGEVIRGYTVKFFEQDADGGAEREIRPAEVNVASSSATGVWATTPRSLPAGIYRVDITGASGYREPTTQQLDPDLPPMQFRVLPLLDDATEIPVLVADRYPDISGRVYEPRLVADTRTEFDPIDDATLTVTMSCNAGPEVSVPTTDEFGLQGGGELDSFFLTRQAVDANDLIGSCQLTFATDGYVTKIVDVPDVEISDGNTLSDRVVNAALVQPTDTFGGRVFWVDDRFATELPLVGVDIAADAITSLTPTDAGPPPPGQVPTIATTTITTQSTAAGAWTLDGQVFGPARYTFTEPGFGPGQIDVVIDETATRTVTVIGGVNLTEVGGTFDVELEPPNDGAIIGRVQILTTDTQDFDDVGIVATDPFGLTTVSDPADPRCLDATSGLCLTRSAGDFRVDAAPAGTWTTDFTAPAGHILLTGADASVSQLVGPAEQLAGFDTTFVELGRLDLAAFDSVSGDPITTGATLRLTGNASLDDTFTSGTGPDANVYSLDDIPVHPTDPLGVTANYSLEVVIAGYDSSAAQVFINGALVGSNSAAIPVSFLAGQKPQIEVRLPEFGAIVTSAVGQIEPSGPPTEALVLDPATGPALEVTVVEVTQSGQTVPGFDPATVLVEPFGVDQFRISGPPAYYRVTVGHDEFVPTVPPTVPTDNCVSAPLDPNPCPPPPAVAGVFSLRNANTNTLGGQFVLQLRPSSVSIETVDSLATGNPVTTAEYVLSRTGLTPSLTGAVTGGDITLTDILPGTYRLEIRSYSAPNVENAFPVITDIVVRRSTVAAPATTAVRAPLPLIGASITGNLSAINSLGGPVPLPTTITITSDFDEPQIDVDDALQANEVSGDASATVTAGPSTDLASFSVPNVAVGTHVLTFNEPAGYTASFDESPDAPVTRTIDVTAIGPTPVPVDPLTYTVDDITSVTATIQGLDTREVFPSLDAKLVPPGSNCTDAGITGDPTVNANSVTVEFVNVPPHRDGYTLCTTDELHEDFQSAALVVPVVERDGSDMSTHFLGTFNPVASVARVTGALTESNGGVPSPITPGATLELIDQGGAVVQTVSGPASPYSLDVDDTPGSYTVRLSKSGYATSEVVVQLVNGLIVDAPITITDLVTFNISITNNPTPAGLSVAVVSQGQQVFPATAIGAPPASSFTAQVPAGSYRIQVSGGGVVGNFFEPSSGFISPVAGTTVTRNIELPRTLTVNVTNGGDATTVQVFGAGGLVATQGPIDSASPSFVFPTGTGATQIPADGSLTIRVSADERRTREFAVPTGFGPTVAAPLLSDLRVRGQVLRPGGGNVGNGATVTATATGMADGSDGTNGSGNYDISGLGNDVDGTSVTWTLTADEVGEGIGTTTVTVSSDGPPTPLDDQDIIVTPQPITVNITVRDSRGSNAPIPGASVLLGTQPAVTTNASGVATFTILENATTAERTYSATATDFGASGNVVLPAISGNRAARNVNLDLDIDTVDVSFALSGAPSGDALGSGDATVTLTGQGNDNTNGSGIAEFGNVPVDAGPINWSVTGNNGFGDTSGTITDLRTATFPISVSVADPPP